MANTAPASLLPPNATPLETALAQTIAARIGGLSVPLRDLWNPARCPLAALPWLAWTLGVEGWDSAWPESVKRARIAASIPIHRYKGTLKAVQDVVTAYGGNVRLTLWHEMTPPGPPFSFTLSVTLGAQEGAAPTAAFINAMIEDISRAKGARDTFAFTVALSAAAPVGLFAAARPAVFARITAQATNA